MSAPARADTREVRQRIRPILVATLAVASAYAYLGPAAALGTHAGVAHARARHHSTSCASTGAKHRRSNHTRKASYRTTHRAHHITRCVRRHVTRRAVKHSHRPIRRHSAGAAGGCADTDLAPSASNVERVRAAVVCLVNRERAAHGESALQPNARLEQAAQSHTESMAFGNYFEHVGPRGDTPAGRMHACGYIYSSQVGYEIAENLAWGTQAQGTPRAVVAAWMASAGHRENILNPRLRDTAVGVSPHVPSSMGGGQAGGMYTQDFGVIIRG